MRFSSRSPIRVALLGTLIAFSSGLAHAQGSGGGSISNDDKSLSGSRDSRPAESSKPSRRSSGSDESRRASRKGGGGGSNPFDGAWMVYGRGVTCQGTSSNAIVVTSGQIIGQTARGTVSPGGQVNGHASSGGLTIITTGRLSGRSGGGTFRQSDGCSGTWTAAKQ
ncbi:MAG: hypothetical protein PS018_13190 [bacterium]|nr:hypothetical protein [bacterium]